MTSPMPKNTPEQLNTETTTANRISAANRNSGKIQNLPAFDIEKKTDYQELFHYTARV
jgi:hypothetical protein